MMAAVTIKTVPTRVDVNFTDERMAKAVPSEVDDSVAPAGNVVSFVVPLDEHSGMRKKDIAIGAQNP